MNAKRWHWLSRLLRRRPQEPPEIAQARELIKAIDRGGIPLNPARVNVIAREIGLEVSRKAPVEDTVQRIRQAIARASR